MLCRHRTILREAEPGRVDRLGRQLSGNAHEQDLINLKPDSLEQLDECLRDVGAISESVEAEIQALHDRAKSRA